MCWREENGQHSPAHGRYEMGPVITVPTGIAFHEGPAGPSVPGLVTTVKAPG